MEDDDGDDDDDDGDDNDDDDEDVDRLCTRILKLLCSGTLLFGGAGQVSG